MFFLQESIFVFDVKAKIDNIFSREFNNELDYNLTKVTNFLNEFDKLFYEVYR
ncbi:MAG: hypothetical protein KatS3mg129_1724 [Leptospiraceae bacterium]|nr:MAG: hypothetical protein KatS3mg129_1724 [Leptospiraceae bacterium]